MSAKVPGRHIEVCQQKLHQACVVGPCSVLENLRKLEWQIFQCEGVVDTNVSDELVGRTVRCGLW